MGNEFATQLRLQFSFNDNQTLKRIPRQVAEDRQLAE